MPGILVKRYDFRHGLYSWQEARASSPRVPKRIAAGAVDGLSTRKKLLCLSSGVIDSILHFPRDFSISTSRSLASTASFTRYLDAPLQTYASDRRHYTLAMHFWAPVSDMKTRNGTTLKVETGSVKTILKHPCHIPSVAFRQGRAIRDMYVTIYTLN